MILSCLLFLLGRLPASDLVRSLLAGGLWLLLLWALFRTVRRGLRNKKHKFLGACLALLLVIDMAGLLPYLDPRERSVSLEPVEAVTIESLPSDGYAFTCYSGLGPNRDPEAVAEEIRAAGGNFDPIDPRGYTYVYVWGREADALSYSVWDSPDDFPIPFKPMVYWAALDYGEAPLSPVVYVYRIPYRPLEFRGTC